jgi:hypothetical protein
VAKCEVDFPLNSDIKWVTHLRVLAWNLDLIEFAVLELSEIVTEEVERLDAWSGVEVLFLPVPPLLQLPDVLIMCEFTFDEIFLVFSLLWGQFCLQFE